MARGRRRKELGVYWGRFNPPHKGHLSMVRKFNRTCRLVIAIGSSEHRNEPKDPFSGAERKEMWEAYLAESGIQDVGVVTLEDGPSESWSVDNLVKKCEPDLLFLSTERASLAKLARSRVRVVPFRRTGAVSSTLIRDMIASGDDRWRGLTGGSVARLIADFDGPRRIRSAYAKVELI